MKWSETQIARCLALQLFNRSHLVVVPNCNWTGYECDLLCVTNDLRVIDVEIKISRADLKADAKKDKWWRHRFDIWHSKTGPQHGPCPEPREWPAKVWKHYYALPADIWCDSLLGTLPSKTSGVLLLRGNKKDPDLLTYDVRRRATPNRAAAKISPESAVSVARLASLRMWDAYQKLDAARNKAAT